MNVYCEYCLLHPEDEFNTPYHNTQYGFPIQDDDQLFERLILEINQAGLSWITILKKAAAFRVALDGFQISSVANYTSSDVERLMSNPGIIRNQKKIEATIFNAQVIAGLQSQYGSFGAWLDQHCGSDLPSWVKLFKAQFRFTGSEIVKEFLISSGYLAGAHSSDCPIFADVVAMQPAWYRASKAPMGLGTATLSKTDDGKAL